jgi:hypothetical protein
MVQAWLWTLYRLAHSLGHRQAARDILTAAHAELERQSRTISDHQVRHSFFENVPLNRAIVEAYDVLVPVARTQTVSLASLSAPLGRALRPDEYVTVTWTINASEDSAIADKTERRLYRLARLVQQAEASGAAPTDADLAQALGVSRRTILRDMQTLKRMRSSPPTRKRKTRKNDPLPP